MTSQPLRPHDDTHTCWFGSEAVVVDSTRRLVHHLNASASTIWSVLDDGHDGRDADGVARAVARHVGLPTADIGTDVTAALDDFAGLGLFEADPVGADTAPTPPRYTPGEPPPPLEPLTAHERSGLATIGPFAAFDHAFTARVPPTLASTVQALLRHHPPGSDGGTTYVLRSDPDLADTYALEADGETLSRRGPEPSAISILLWHVHRAAIASCDGTVLHAACLALGGHTVLVPAHSGAGKSTLAAGLAGRGWAYLTDEAVELTVDGIRGLGKAVSLRPDTLVPLGLDAPDRVVDLGEKRWLLPVDGPTPDRSPVDLVASPVYDPDGRSGTAELAPAEAMLVLCQQVFEQSRLDGDTVRLLQHLAREVPAIRVTYGDVDVAERLLRAALSDG